MRLEFTHSDLMDSSEYYNQFIKPIYEISKHVILIKKADTYRE